LQVINYEKIIINTAVAAVDMRHVRLTTPMVVITMPHIQDTTITNIPTITGIMGDMATVITRPLGLAMVTAEAIMVVILLMDGIMVVVIRLMVGIMAVIEAVTAGAIIAVVLAAFMAAGGLEAAFTVVIDKNGNIFKQN
jgi:hypothetical protein